MTNSIEKFEAWCKTIGMIPDHIYFQIWLAGRESMRDEAVAVDFRGRLGLTGGQAYDVHNLIKEIQP
jgi:hypothetical protein